MAKRTRTALQRKSNRESVRKSLPIRVGQAEKMIKGELQKEIKQSAALLVRAPGRPVGSKAFQSVMRAKELLAESSILAVKMIRKAGKIAAAKGDSTPAEFLLRHASAEHEGKTIRPVATSVDKLESDSGNRAPVINIGWIAAPVRPELPTAPVIDVLALPERTDS